MKFLVAVVAAFAIGFMVGNSRPKFDLDFLAAAATPTPAPAPVVTATPSAWMYDTRPRTSLDRGPYEQTGPRYSTGPNYPGLGATPSR
ncbi:MAG TPA: hypothetical protein VGM54_25375 [Chthoniobacter sp.]